MCSKNMEQAGNQTGVLSHLLPEPIAIQENDIHGYLLIDGNIEKNCLLFRILFTNPDKVVPVFLELKIGSKKYRYLLSNIDITNPMMKSPVVFPETAITEGIKILCVKPFLEKKVPKSVSI